jgi:exportin-T
MEHQNPLHRVRVLSAEICKSDLFSSVLRNKFAHTLTLFFLCSYIEQWPTFFSDLFTLIRPNNPDSTQAFNRHVSLLFFHILIEISEEVADQALKASRTFNSTRHARDGRVRDAVRERDAARINEAVLEIVNDGVVRMSSVRKVGPAQTQRELEEAIEVVDWGVRTFGAYVCTCQSSFASFIE